MTLFFHFKESSKCLDDQPLATWYITKQKMAFHAQYFFYQWVVCVFEASKILMCSDQWQNPQGHRMKMRKKIFRVYTLLHYWHQILIYPRFLYYLMKSVNIIYFDQNVDVLWLVKPSPNCLREEKQEYDCHVIVYFW